MTDLLGITSRVLAQTLPLSRLRARILVYDLYDKAHDDRSANDIKVRLNR